MKDRLFDSRIWALIAAFLLLLLVSSCYNDKEELLYGKTGKTDCSTAPASFAADVLPIITGHCATAGCHDANSGVAGVVLSNYSQVSQLAVRIRQRCIIDKTMPPGAPLSTAQVNVLSCWIDAGTPNN